MQTHNTALAADCKAPEPHTHSNTGADRATAELQAAITAAISALRDQSTKERVANSYTRQEIAQLDSIDRLRLLRNAAMEGMCRFYARHPQADVGPGVYIIALHLSDNGRYGASYLQVSRFAEALCRDQRTITRALRKLVDDGMLREEERPGKTTLYWPVYSKAIDIGAQATWFIDAAAPAPKRGPGRPRKTPDTSAQGLIDKPPAPHARGIPKTPDTAEQNPRHVLTGDLTRELRESEAHTPHDVIVNGSTIGGPGFTIDLKAVDMAAALAGMPAERARQLAEICARDWTANRIKPASPIAMVRAAIVSDRNRAAVQNVRMARAAESPQGRRRPESSNVSTAFSIRSDAKGAPFDPRKMDDSWWCTQVRQHHITGRKWPCDYGPPPGDPGFLGPESALREMGETVS